MGFSANEVIQQAIQIEIMGAELYREASKLVTDQEARQIFMFLAREEENHIKVFERIAASLGIDSTPYEDEAATHYIKSLVDTQVFKEADAVLDKIRKGKTQNPVKEIIEFALGVEKESLLFFYSLKDMAPEHQNLLSALIEEEKGHIVQLSHALEKKQ